jgi:D-beta-D-heptose 7-phosphate kinase/D-beta-D-heptose 1-phosphate adenosyltransferase
MIVVSDYAKGTVTPAVLQAILASGTRVLVDPKGTDYSRYRGAYGITPNRAEAEAATGVVIEDATALERAAAALFDIVDAEVVLITLGAEGIYCALRSGRDFHIQSEARKVFDVTGAGDTVIALLARYLAADVALPDAVRIANAGAGVVVGRLGAVSVTLTELYRALRDEPTANLHKFVRREDARGLARDLRQNDLSIVFTNGCFDLMHAGHARYLAQAKTLGDVLVVGLNDDASVRRLKGAERPLMALEERAALLAALAAVDFVVPFAEDTPGELIQEITPAVLVKGEDWRDRGVVGQEWVEQHGGKVVLTPLLEGESTTTLIERIRSRRGV